MLSIFREVIKPDLNYCMGIIESSFDHKLNKIDHRLNQNLEKIKRGDIVTKRDFRIMCYLLGSISALSLGVSLMTLWSLYHGG